MVPFFGPPCMFLYVCVLQAVMYCTPDRAKKYVIVLAVASVVLTAVIFLVHYLTHNRMLFDIFAVLYVVLVPIILVINLVIVRELKSRRAVTNVTETIQETHRPSATSANYAVPTGLLTTTAFVFVGLTIMSSLLYVLFFWVLPRPESPSGHHRQWVSTRLVLNFAIIFKILIFVYGFFVYMLTGRQFRAELDYLCCGKFAPFGRPNVAVGEGGPHRRTHSGSAA